MGNLQKANCYARNSCSRWNGPKNEFERKYLGRFFRLSRKWNRERYCMMARKSWTTDKHQYIIDRYKRGDININTYPWPFCHPYFADWEESDKHGDCSLVYDPSGCVVKYSTSYVAWKIFEETGRWPQKKSRTRMNADRWQLFLMEAGYAKYVRTPIKGHHYVGIDVDSGEHGIVVWFEKEAENQPGYCWVSTYFDKQYIFGPARINHYDWVQIN